MIQSILKKGRIETDEEVKVARAYALSRVDATNIPKSAKQTSQ